jgi:hypothetical protein
MSASERRIAELEREVKKLEYLLSQQLRTGDGIWWESILSHQDGTPRVRVSWGDMGTEMSTDDARQMAVDIIAVADAAEYDKAFIDALTKPEPEGPGLGMGHVAAMLSMMRKERWGSDLASGRGGNTE